VEKLSVSKKLGGKTRLDLEEAVLKQKAAALVNQLTQRIYKDASQTTLGGHKKRP